MCGITGFFALDGQPASPVVLRRMTDAIAHRGPDGEGWYTDGSVALGNRRLAIIDLTPAGHQPMLSADERYVIAYNGEVFNFQALRVELEAAGWPFRSRTDTEVLLHAFAQWGPAAVERFNGMFALAIWDRKTRRLFLARDRYGIKPLYYAWAGRTFVFGSEVKALLQHPAVSATLDKEALVEYLTFQNYLSDRTLFGGVRLLQPGTHLTLEPDGTEPAPVRYWDFCFREPSAPADDREYVEELDRLFRQAVRRQLVSDVPVATYLSGGIDSGSITAIAAGELPHLQSFTCGFDLRSASGLELGFDERERAERMSYLFRTEQYEMVLKAGDMERVMPRLTRHLEEPRIGQSYPNFYMAQLASKFVKVVLAGTGGDELFGGYPWRYTRALAGGGGFDSWVDAYYFNWHRLMPNTVLREALQPIAADVSQVWTRDIFADVFLHHDDRLTDPVSCINHSLYFEARTFLHSLLVVEDKLSMAHGLETRVPFLDNDLVDFAMRVPVHLKVSNLSETPALNENEPGRKTERYYGRTRDGKLLMRQVMSRYVPPDVSGGEKQGFSAPDASWFKGESIEYVRRRLLEGNPRIYEYLHRPTIERLVGGHINGEQNRRLLIWSLLSLESWCEEFL